ncbi:MAG TPA: site-specific DNA-methyltransferase, partial [Gammaproteobacteria bacterium]|nr:site-specific DNA-methyltransferase [Gammaproteobacteria bacterium]
LLGDVAPSSVRSYLRLNTPEIFKRNGRGLYTLREQGIQESRPVPYSPPSRRAPLPAYHFGRSSLYLCDCFPWLLQRGANSIHAVVTDPPYGLFEYSAEQQRKLRAGRGGVWRIPPSFDGTIRSPLPRFTVLTDSDLR